MFTQSSFMSFFKSHIFRVCRQNHYLLMQVLLNLTIVFLSIALLAQINSSSKLCCDKITINTMVSICQPIALHDDADFSFYVTLKSVLEKLDQQLTTKNQLAKL